MPTRCRIALKVAAESPKMRRKRKEKSEREKQGILVKKIGLFLTHDTQPLFKFCCGRAGTGQRLVRSFREPFFGQQHLGEHADEFRFQRAHLLLRQLGTGHALRPQPLEAVRRDVYHALDDLQAPAQFYFRLQTGAVVVRRCSGQHLATETVRSTGGGGRRRSITIGLHPRWIGRGRAQQGEVAIGVVVMKN